MMHIALLNFAKLYSLSQPVHSRESETSRSHRRLLISNLLTLLKLSEADCYSNGAANSSHGLTDGTVIVSP